VWIQNDYNCYSAALDITESGTINEDGWIYSGSEADTKLNSNYSEVEESEAKFGKTVVRYSNDQGKTSGHYAVFFGRDKSGRMYVLTKNGSYNIDIQPSDDLHVNPNESILGKEYKIQSYGKPSGYYNKK
jgi:hypothetical protein